MSEEDMRLNGSYKATNQTITTVEVEEDELDLHKVTRRELQYLAKELHLCRANVKSEVIVSFLKEFIKKEEEGKEKIMFLLDTMPEEAKMIAGTPLMSVTPATRSRELRNGGNKVLITPRAMDFSDVNLSTEPTPTPLRRSTRKAALLSQQHMTGMDTRSREDHAVPQTTPISRKISFGTEPPTPDIDVIGAPRFDDERIENIQIQDVVQPQESIEKQQIHPELHVERAHPEELIEYHDHEEVVDERKYEEYSEQPDDEACKQKEECFEEREKEGIVNDNWEEQVQIPQRKPLASIENSLHSRSDNNPVPSKISLDTYKNDVKSLVDSMDDLSFLDNGKVRCLSTGHEMKADSDVILSYISGKKYYRAKALHISFDSYAPMFVEHPDPSQSHMLWCVVTETAVPRDIDRIEAHIHGVRYQKMFPEWHAELMEEMKLHGLPTPKGKKIYFDENTPTPAKKSQSKWNFHWSYEEYENEECY